MRITITHIPRPVLEIDRDRDAVPRIHAKPTLAVDVVFNLPGQNVKHFLAVGMVVDRVG